jgi:hypothetical protein
LSFEGDELEEGQSTEKEVAVPPEYTWFSEIMDSYYTVSSNLSNLLWVQSR